jgi:membrane-associated protein
MNEFFQNVWDTLATITVNFLKPEVWPEALARFYWPVVVAVALIIFAETGLLVGFFLPGDSLLVTVGIVARASNWDIWTMMAILMAAAIVGDTAGFWFGAKAGNSLFNRPNSRWLKQDHIVAAKAFFDKHGGIAIVLARFVPFARTFVPVVAGAARMNYTWFIVYNIIGGVLWIGSMLLLGYYAVDVLEPPLKKIFGEQFQLRSNIKYLAAVIILVSVAPIAIGFVRKRFGKKNAELPTPANVPTN